MRGKAKNQKPTRRLPVLVLSGFLGAGKTTVLNHILRHRGGLRVAVLVNDMSSINIDGRLVDHGQAALSRVDERLIEFSNGCICCTLREDLLQEVARLAREGRFDYLLIESTGISEPMPVAETFTFTDASGQSLSDVAALDSMVTVVDAGAFLPELKAAEDLRDRRLGADEGDDRTIADLLVEQVEFADLLVINKADKVSQRRLAQLQATLRLLNPDAHQLVVTRGRVPPDQLLNTRRFSLDKAQKAPGWLKKLNGESLPETEVYGISSLALQAERPLHPRRFFRFLSKPWPGLWRAKGFFWLATRMETQAVLSIAGGACGIEPAGTWWAATPRELWPESSAERAAIRAHWRKPFGDRRQELVFIGRKRTLTALKAAFRRCLLTDAEMAMGPRGWSHWHDPFGDWTAPDESLDQVLPGSLSPSPRS
jgi:G3E family GTPase